MRVEGKAYVLVDRASLLIEVLEEVALALDEMHVGQVLGFL